jgi:ADP-heptose:LPS heptosyltransferase
MQLNSLRRIDNSVGRILTPMVVLVVKLKQTLIGKTESVKPENVKKILVQKYFGIGSTLHTLPLILSLREEYPNATIYFLTLEENRELNDICNIYDEVLTLRTDSIANFLVDLLRKVHFFTKTKFDISIDLEFFANYSLLISILSRSPIRVGFFLNRIRPRGILTHEVYFNHYRHISEIFSSMGSSIGVKHKPFVWRDNVPSFPKEEVKATLSRLKICSDKPIVIFNPNASDMSLLRRWPADYYSELIGSLAKFHQEYEYLIIGSESEREYVDRVIVASGFSDRVLNCAGKTNLRELFLLISACYLVISNDSGPLHIASIFDKNIAGFFGPETPIVYGPVNDNALVFYNSDIYCSPCLNVYDAKKSIYGRNSKNECVRNDCLLSIQPGEVYKQINTLFLNMDKVS